MEPGGGLWRHSHMSITVPTLRTLGQTLRQNPFRHRSGRVALAVVALLAVALAVFAVGYSAGRGGGTGASAGGTGASAGGAGDSAARAAVEPAPGATNLGFSADSGTTASKVAPDEITATAGGSDPSLPGGTRLVRTAQQDLRVDDVSAAAARVRTVATSLGGSVATESLSFGNGSSSMTLRVPEARLDDALARTAELGEELSRTTTSEDVTATIADLDSRVKTQEASVNRVRALLADAKSLKDVVLLEGELTRREAELEAAQARYRALDDQATMATLDLTLSPPGAEPAPKPADDGFLAGFRAGWDAIKASTTVLLTVAGAVLPFALVLGLVLTPALVLRRRRPAA
ncbi:DUF4349 domain-containing protein [Spongisporangium articulatum]|uniref:DUF4349 domain-containing protein n=1 Tax=Spongisporangium articulatum TaxID=3362603 RepID=A0ABW8ATJ3_9ACTN